MCFFLVCVDVVLLVFGLIRKIVIKDGKDEQGFKVWWIIKECKMYKFYVEWYEEECKIKEMKEEELEEVVECEFENDVVGIIILVFIFDEDSGFGKKKKKKGKQVKEEDLWVVFFKKRVEMKVGLYDVVQVLFEFYKEKMRYLKEINVLVDVGSILKVLGSLWWCEEFQIERDNVLEVYWKIWEYEQKKLIVKGL